MVKGLEDRTWETAETYLSENLVALDADELASFVKVLSRELTALVEFGSQTTPNLHDGFEHLVVAVACKENLARIELIQGATDGPHVDSVVVGHAQHNLRGSVEAADQVRCDSSVRRRSIGSIDSRAQVANLENVAALVDLFTVSHLES